MKEKAIELAIDYMRKARTFKSSVGACIYTDKGCYPGFNVESYIHKGYHAEEVALINTMLHNVDPKKVKGIVIVYVFRGGQITSIYPACATCRQWLWEFTNPDILVTVVNPLGKIIFEEKLKKLYPMPYPKQVTRWEE